MIAKGIKFEIYGKEWMGEGPNACGYTYLDDDVAMGIWLMASYKEHAHADMGEYAHAVDEALAEEERRVMEAARQAALAEGMDAEDADVAAEYAVDDWSNRGDEAAVADAVSFEYLENLKELMEEWLDDGEQSSDEYDPGEVGIAEKRGWLEAVSERLARRADR